MTDHFGDDFDFWDDGRSEPTVQLDRVRRRVPERTRSHHVVRLDEPTRDTGSHVGAAVSSADDDDYETMWVETTSGGWSRGRVRGRGAGLFGTIDPRVLSVGAIAVAAVLAVPLFGALSEKDSGEDSFLSVAEAETTTSTTVPPTSVVVITAALNPVAEPADDTAQDASDAVASDSAGNSDSASADAGASSAGGYAGGSDDAVGSEAAAGVLAAPAVRPAAQCGNPYEVQGGDFWVALADAVGVSLDELLDYNEANPETPIYPGSTVCLPLGTSIAPPTDAPTEPPTSTVAPSTAAPATTVPATDPSTVPATTELPATTSPATTTATTEAPAPDDDDDGGIALPTDPAPSGGEVEQMIRDIWPDELEEQALRIAWRESNYRPGVTSPTGCCVGVFQLHWEAHGGWMASLGITSRDQLFDARTNIQAAYVLYQRSGGWGPWQ